MKNVTRSRVFLNWVKVISNYKFLTTCYFLISKSHIMENILDVELSEMLKLKYLLIVYYHQIRPVLILFRMGFLGATHGWGRGEVLAKRSPSS